MSEEEGTVERWEVEEKWELESYISRSNTEELL
jgi:hypothetical protein